MLFRQLFDRQTCTYTYLLADTETHEAILIDPVLEQLDRDTQLLAELGLDLKVCIETHVHADHVTSAARLRQITGCQLAVAKAGAVESADLQLEDGDTVQAGKIVLEARSTPGHTDGCMAFVTSDEKMVFTGDALFIRGCGRTDFQQGDARTLYRSIHDKVFSLPDETIIYPGHDYKGRISSTVGEEKAHNPRLKTTIDEDGFAAIMEGLKLAHPARIDVAVPANLRSGGTDPKLAHEDHGLCAEVVRTATGVPEIGTAWLQDHLNKVRVVDVRQTEELVGELGMIEGVDHVPLATLATAAETWDRHQPICVMCRSGGRSGRGALMLEHMGFSRIASVAGGMLKWNEEGRPTERAARVA